MPKWPCPARPRRRAIYAPRPRSPCLTPSIVRVIVAAQVGPIRRPLLRQVEPFTVLRGPARKKKLLIRPLLEGDDGLVATHRLLLHAVGGLAPASEERRRDERVRFELTINDRRL